MCFAVSAPLKTPTSPAVVVIVASNSALSEGWSLDGYQVKAPYGSWKVNTEPVASVCQPRPSDMSGRVLGAGVASGRPA